jgi:hypothetical protein
MWTRLSLGDGHNWCPRQYDVVSDVAEKILPEGISQIWSPDKPSASSQESASVLAPVSRSGAILSEAQRQLQGLRSRRGRDSTNLSKKKKKKSGSYLDDAGDVDTSPAYTNTTLG